MLYMGTVITYGRGEMVVTEETLDVEAFGIDEGHAETIAVIERVGAAGEWLAVAFNLGYVVLAIFQSVLCWFAGLFGAADLD